MRTHSSHEVFFFGRENVLEPIDVRFVNADKTKHHLRKVSIHFFYFPPFFSLCRLGSASLIPNVNIKLVAASYTNPYPSGSNPSSSPGVYLLFFFFVFFFVLFLANISDHFDCFSYVFYSDFTSVDVYYLSRC